MDVTQCTDLPDQTETDISHRIRAQQRLYIGVDISSAIELSRTSEHGGPDRSEVLMRYTNGPLDKREPEE